RGRGLARLGGELGAQIAALALDRAEQRVALVVDAVQAREAEGAGELVDVAVGRHAGRGRRHARAAEEAGLSGVAARRIDPDAAPSPRRMPAARGWPVRCAAADSRFFPSRWSSRMAITPSPRATSMPSASARTIVPGGAARPASLRTA